MNKAVIVYNLLITTALAGAAMYRFEGQARLILGLMFLPIVLYFIRRLRQQPTLALKPLPRKVAAPVALTGAIEGEELSEVEVSDINRRLFFKLIGTAGLTTFAFSLVTRRTHAAFFGSVPGPGTVAIKDSQGNMIDPAEKGPTDGYQIVDLDDVTMPSYYGFVNKDGAWYITRESANGSYRYTRGSSDYVTAWNTRTLLVYGRFDDIF